MLVPLCSDFDGLLIIRTYSGMPLIQILMTRKFNPIVEQWNGRNKCMGGMTPNS